MGVVSRNTLVSSLFTKKGELIFGRATHMAKSLNNFKSFQTKYPKPLNLNNLQKHPCLLIPK